jgi:biotin carboxylase
MTGRRRTVLVLEPESSGLDLIHAAAQLGLAVQLFDHRPLDEMALPARQAVAAGTATYRQVDTRSAKATLDAARELTRQCQLIAVVPGFEYAVPIAASVAAELGLPGIAPEAAAALREKDRMKQTLAKAGMNVAAGVAFRLSEAEDAIDEYLRTAGFPAVIKPIDGSGSLLVRRVDTVKDLHDYLEHCRSGTVDSMGRPIGERLLLETYIAGPEFSVEGYATEDGVTVVAITQKQLGPEPDFTETGHIVDAPLTSAERNALTSAATSAVKILGLTLGVFHLEARLTAQGPVVLEVAARLAGDRIPVLVSQVHGVDLADTMIRCHAGMPIEAPPAQGEAGTAASQFFTVDTPSTLPEPNLLVRRLTTLDGCIEAVITASPDTPLLPATDWRQRFGRIVVTAADRGQLETVLREAQRLIRDAVEPIA